MKQLTFNFGNRTGLGHRLPPTHVRLAKHSSAQKSYFELRRKGQGHPVDVLQETFELLETYGRLKQSDTPDRRCSLANLGLLSFLNHADFGCWLGSLFAPHKVAEPATLRASGKPHSKWEESIRGIFVYRHGSLPKEALRDLVNLCEKIASGRGVYTPTKKTKELWLPCEAKEVLLKIATDLKNKRADGYVAFTRRNSSLAKVVDWLVGTKVFQAELARAQKVAEEAKVETDKLAGPTGPLVSASQQ